MGKVYVAFADSREAKRAMEKVHMLQPEWRVFPLTAKEYVQHSEASLVSQTSDFEGQLLVTIYYDSRNPDLDQHTAARSLESLALTFGDIKAFTAIPTGQDNMSEFHVEFFNTRDADNFLTTLNGTSIDVSVYSTTTGPCLSQRVEHELELENWDNLLISSKGLCPRCIILQTRCGRQTLLSCQPSFWWR